MKFVKTLLLSTLFTMSFTLLSFAEIPSGSILLGDKAFQLEYLTEEHNSEINAAFESGNFQFYFKDYDGTWYDAFNKKYDSDKLPQITYKNVNGVTSVYKEKDGVLITDDSFTIIDIK